MRCCAELRLCVVSLARREQALADVQAAGATVTYVTMNDVTSITAPIFPLTQVGNRPSHSPCCSMCCRDAALRRSAS